MTETRVVINEQNHTVHVEDNVSVTVIEHPHRVTVNDTEVIVKVVEERNIIQLPPNVIVKVSDESIGVITVGVPGPPGAAGVPGPQGPPGPQGASGEGGDKYYRHVQGSPASLWTIVHNLGKRASIVTVDSLGDRVHGDERYVDDNTIEVSFSAPFGGEAYAN